MWRRSSYEENWERRKAYLFRNLFQENALSPVPEADSSLESHTSRTYPESKITRKRSSSPYSPLPPLIIEREPNKHDEPEEYYKKLEIRIMKAYRRLFIEDQSDVSNVSDSDSSINDLINVTQNKRGNFEVVDVKNLHPEDIDENNVKILSEFESDEPREHLLYQNRKDTQANESDQESYVEETISSITETLPKSTIDLETENKSSTEITSSISDDEETSKDSSGIPFADGYKVITFKADVHRNPEEVIVKKSLFDEKNANEIIVNDDTDEDRNGLIKLRENYVSDNYSSENEAPQHIEVMRCKRIHPSFGSLQKESSQERISNHADVTERYRSLESHTEADDSIQISTNEMNFEESIDYDVLQTSTDIQEKYHRNLPHKGDSTKKRKSSTVLSHQTKRVRHEDVSVQATEVDDFNRNIFFDNIFSGTPRVFRLCSCVNHVCN